MINAMQQSTLNKMRSLDNYATESDRQQQVTTARQITKNSSGGGAKQLLHSVSIVVELAGGKDVIPVERDVEQSHNIKGETSEELARFGCSSFSGEEAEKDGEDKDDDEEEEEEEEEDVCLSSKLTRKLVLVDEADKIMRSRAQSSAGVCRPASQPSDGTRHKPLEGAPYTSRPRGFSVDASHRPAERGAGWAPPVPPRAKDRPAASTSCSTEKSVRSEASSPRLFSHYRKGSQSGSELAERGELVRLGMRRNTHHFSDSINQVPPSSLTSRLQPDQPSQQVASAQPNALDPSLTKSGEATPSADSGSLSGATQEGRGKVVPLSAGRRALDVTTRGGSSNLSEGANHFSPLLNSSSSSNNNNSNNNSDNNNNNNRNWSQRRQSLQISLLSSGARAVGAGKGGQVFASSNPSKSLTEEELRGEREFNEQVRSVLKSPLAVDLSGGNLREQANQREQKFAYATIASEARSKSADNKQPSSWLRQQQHIASENFPLTSERQLTARLGKQGEELVQVSGTESSLTSTSQSSTPRRVSFSCIDSVLVGASPKLQNTRASFAFISSSNKQTEKVNFLKQQAQQQPSFHSNSISVSNSTQTQSEFPAATNQQQLRSKRHSISVESQQIPEQQHLREKSLLRTRRISLGPTSPLVHSQQKKTISCAGQHKELMDLASSLTQKTVGKIMLQGNSEQQPAISQETHSVNPNNKMDSISTTNSTTSTNSDVVATTVQVSETLPETDCNRVQSIMANAKLRQEEFARLLEEHEQIVNEINRVETKISSSSQTNLQQTQQQHDSNNKE